MRMNSTIQGCLRSLVGNSIYQRAKCSWIYDSYWRIANKRIVDDRRREIEFYQTLLKGFRKRDLIFDIGANLGYKTGIFLKLGARVVSVEPDETSQEILTQSFLKYRLKNKPVVVVPKAVSEENGTMRMWIDTPGSAVNTISEKWAETLRTDNSRFGERLAFAQWKEVETVSVERLVEQYGSPFFVKIDVEGHELSVLRGMQRPVPYLSFEVNLPEFRSEGLECVQVLGRLARNGQFNYTADCRQGLAMARWPAVEEFLPVLNRCGDRSIEVYWRTTAGS